MKIEVTMAVGYDHGSWEEHTVEVGMRDDDDFKKAYLFWKADLHDLAETKLEEELGYTKDISFIHVMNYKLKKQT